MHKKVTVAKDFATTLSDTPCLSNLIAGFPKTFFCSYHLPRIRQENKKRGTQDE